MTYNEAKDRIQLIVNEVKPKIIKGLTDGDENIEALETAIEAFNEYKKLKAENGRLTRELEQAYEQIIKLKGKT